MPDVRLVPWSEDDLPLLRRANVPEMTLHLGGPEPDTKVVERHARYVALAATDTGRMFTVTVDGETAGSVGYWDRVWRNEPVFEIGWSVLPEFQGRGVAVAATVAALDLAREDGRYRWVHAFPGVDNAASNAVCRKAGFELLGEHDFEYPPGTVMRCHDWRYDLRA